jgi:catechol 2,3-dioxygenase-like lactoylglutathione lyase family enzyme
MLADTRIVAFLASTDLERSTTFLVDVVGLTRRETNPFAAVFDGLGAELRVTLVADKAAAPYTVLGWAVADVAAAARDLRSRGAVFHRYDGMDQDDDDVWTAPGGARIAWFSDPDGNVLSLQQIG